MKGNPRLHIIFVKWNDSFWKNFNSIRIALHSG